MNSYLNLNKKQSGATLIVALVILAIMTVLGLASIRSSNLEIKMSASQRDQSVAFQAAESALLAVEQDLIANPKSLAQHLSNCGGNAAGCFSTECKGGFCFAGEFTGNDSTCSVLSPDGGEIIEFWRNPKMWENAAKMPVPLVVEAEGNTTQEVPYLVEFLCMVPRDDLIGEDAGNPTLPLYRITVRAEGEAKRASVALQSVLRGNFR